MSEKLTQPRSHGTGASSLAAKVNEGLAYVNGRDFQRAARVFEEVLKVDPSHAHALVCLGSCCNALGHYQEAITHFETLLAIQPENAQALTYFGAAKQYLGRHDEAESAYRRALSLQPDLADAQCNLGRLLFSSGYFEEARSCLEHAVRVQADHQVALCGLAMIDEREGQPESGLARLMPLIEQGIASSEAVITAARLCRIQGDFQRSLDLLQALADQAGLPHDGVVQSRFSMGRSYDGLGSYAEAWSCFDEANRLKRVRYEGQNLETAVDRVIRFFSPKRVVPTVVSEGHRPVFLIGLPRSGKSLLEGLLAQHSAVKACGELTSIGEIGFGLASGKLAYPEALAMADQSTLIRFAMEYRRSCGTLAEGETHTLDTLPGNFLHLGLIKTLFPNAAIIWCRRDPLDTALFCFFKNFSGDSFRFSFSQEDIVHYFGQFYKTMDHWLSLYGDGLHTVDYEGLVVDPQRELQKALAYLDLDTAELSDLSHLRDDELKHHRHYLKWIETMAAGLGERQR